MISCDEENYGCDGGNIPSAMDIITKRKGVPKTDKFPYSPFNIQPDDICTNSDIYKINEIYRMSYYGVKNQDILKRILLKKPLSITLSANDLVYYYPNTTY